MVAAVHIAAEARQPTLVHCGACGEEWIAAWTPAPVDAWAAELLRNRHCPACNADRALMGKAPQPEGAGNA